MKMYVTIRESGDVIEVVETVDEGMAIINELEKEDMENGTYEENFYAITDENNCTVNF